MFFLDYEVHTSYYWEYHRKLISALGFRQFAASTEEYAKRNYANNVEEYNTVVSSLTAQRRVYDDMMLDGVQPTRDVFHSLIVGTMKGARLQDAFFFRDEMKAMGLVPNEREIPQDDPRLLMVAWAYDNARFRSGG